MNEQLLARLWDAVQTRTLQYSRHYLTRLLERPMPGRSDIRYVLCDDDPEVIEVYQRYHGETGQPSCLIWGVVDGRVAHVQCSQPPDPVVVTAYWPSSEPAEWTDNYKRRIQR